MERLRQFVEIIRKFKMPAAIRENARRLGIPGGIVSSVADLETALFVAHWRAMPMQLDVPSSSQVFGQLVAHAGIEGIIFPSVRSGTAGNSLAVFPQNLQGDSFVQLADPTPAATKNVRLDAKTWRAFVLSTSAQPISYDCFKCGNERPEVAGIWWNTYLWRVSDSNRAPGAYETPALTK